MHDVGIFLAMNFLIRFGLGVGVSAITAAFAADFGFGHTV